LNNKIAENHGKETGTKIRAHWFTGKEDAASY
jgi:hypothetical protein